MLDISALNRGERARDAHGKELQIPRHDVERRPQLVADGAEESRLDLVSGLPP